MRWPMQASCQGTRSRYLTLVPTGKTPGTQSRQFHHTWGSGGREATPKKILVWIMSPLWLTLRGALGRMGHMPYVRLGERQERVDEALSREPDVCAPVEMPVVETPVTTRERMAMPRMVFHMAPLSPDQRKGIRTVLFIVRMLEARVRAAGSIRHAAKLMGVSKTFLAKVLRGQCPPGYHLASQVGYLPRLLYVRMPASDGPLKVGAGETVKQVTTRRWAKERYDRGLRGKTRKFTTAKGIPPALRGIL